MYMYIYSDLTSNTRHSRQSFSKKNELLYVFLEPVPVTAALPTEIQYMYI